MQPASIRSVAYRSTRPRKADELLRASIAALLKNLFYSGDFLWNRKRYQGKHPPIVDKELFDRVQAVIAQRNDTCAAGYRFATSGLLKWSRCGCSITAEISTRPDRAAREGRPELY